jgi:cell wall-associated NlpC family hydrolase
MAMLQAEIGVPASPSTVRRRQILLGLTAITAVAALAALGSGSSGAWWAVAGMVAADLVYLALLHRSRRIATEREFEAMMEPSNLYLETLSQAPVAPILGAREELEVTVELRAISPVQQVWALVRFAVSCAAGWALAPFVFALTLLVGRTPRDTTGQRWLANLQAAQTHLREQSLRTLAVSAATTASVTAAGTIAVLGGAGPVSATTIAATASLPATAGLPAGMALAASTGGSVYRVALGDTLWGIAARFGSSVNALALANRISDPSLIYPGQVLAIPAGSGSSLTTAGSDHPPGNTYTVHQGDTLWAIAARYGTTVSVLASTNNLTNPNVIQPGEVLVVSGGAVRRSPTRPVPVTVRARPRPTPRPPSPPAPQVTAPSAAGATAARAALAQVGKPYQWAGAGPYSFDCSGLVMYAWAHAGVGLPHYTVSQYQDTMRIAESQLRPGDLVFYDTGDGAQPGHVTIYIGNGQIVTADSPGTDVRVESIDWDGVPMGFGRVR